MSHFVCMVAGDDHEKALAPFHEFECTGMDDEYVRNLDVTEESLSEWEGGQSGKTFAEWLVGMNHEEFVVPFGQQPKTKDCHKYGYATADQYGTIIKVVRRTNPNSKWDSWRIGGRWSNWAILKDGSRSNQFLAGEYSFDRMAANAAAEKAEQVDPLFAAMDDLRRNGVDPTWGTWPVIRSRHEGDIGAASNEYHGQSALAALKKTTERLRLFFDFDELLLGRESLLKKAARNGCAPFAFIGLDGKWAQKGDIEGWPMVFATMFRALHPETRITVVDCHV